MCEPMTQVPAAPVTSESDAPWHPSADCPCNYCQGLVPWPDRSTPATPAPTPRRASVLAVCTYIPSVVRYMGALVADGGRWPTNEAALQPGITPGEAVERAVLLACDILTNPLGLCGSVAP